MGWCHPIPSECHQPEQEFLKCSGLSAEFEVENAVWFQVNLRAIGSNDNVEAFQNVAADNAHFLLANRSVEEADRNI